MKNLKLTVFMLITSANLFAFSFNSLFHSHKHRRTTPETNYAETQQDYNDYCNQQQTSYGFQIICSYPNEVNSFKIDASATVKCKQITKGTNSDYPDKVDIPIDFIKKMNLCENAQVFGPNVLYTFNISESNQYVGTQTNHTNTYYDIVCNNSESYTSDIYNTKQIQFNNSITTKYNQCLTDITATNSSGKYILAFKILFFLAVISFILRFYFKYQTIVNNYLIKIKNKLIKKK